MFADQHGAELLYEHYDATVLDDTAMSYGDKLHWAFYR
jgi:hypothetical protein